MTQSEILAFVPGIIVALVAIIAAVRIGNSGQTTLKSANTGMKFYSKTTIELAHATTAAAVNAAAMKPGKINIREDENRPVPFIN